ncbi:MAG: cytochrome b [Candidatus Methylumidiphilus sp.]
MSNPTTETSEKYPFPLRTLHWLAAAGFAVLFITGPIMVDLDKTDPLRADLFGLHKSFGVIAIILLVARLRVRWRATLPALPASLQDWELTLAHWGHRGLYALMIITPIVGWADSNFHGRPVKLFGIPLPKLFPTIENIGTTPGLIHTVLAYTLLGLVAVHVAAVVKHRYFDKADVLRRMV